MCAGSHAIKADNSPLAAPETANGVYPGSGAENSSLARRGGTSGEFSGRIDERTARVAVGLGQRRRAGRRQLRLAGLVRPRRFSPDPFRPASVVTEDLREHPVVQTLWRRHRDRSRPGARSDDRRVALVIEGGGMRGVVSAGMAAAIEQLGLRDAFDEVHGASAGAFNGAFLLAGQAAYLATLYGYGFGDPRFVSALRALRGGPAFDMDHVINHVWTRQRPLRFEAIAGSGIDLHCTATDADRAAIVDLTDLRGQHEICCALRASARLPWLAGGPVEFRGMRLLDATLAEAIPVHVARATATDLLVLQTRPHGVRHTPLSPIVAKLTDRYLRPINPDLVHLRETRSERYDALTAELSAHAADPARTPAVCVIRPAAGAAVVSQMESRQTVLQTAAADGMRAAWMALAGEDPELIGTLRAYPRGPRATDEQANGPGRENLDPATRPHHSTDAARSAAQKIA
jgi:predicted patatin/cPLA2 family phospholipase